MDSPRSLRRLPAVYLAGFLLAAAAAPHHVWLDHRETLAPLGRTPPLAEPALPAPIEKLPASRSPPPPF